MEESQLGSELLAENTPIWLNPTQGLHGPGRPRVQELPRTTVFRIYYAQDVHVFSRFEPVGAAWIVIHLLAEFRSVGRGRYWHCSKSAVKGHAIPSRLRCLCFRSLIRSHCSYQTTFQA